MDINQAQDTIHYEFRNASNIREALQAAGLSLESPEGNKRLAQFAPGLMKVNRITGCWL